MVSLCAHCAIVVHCQRGALPTVWQVGVHSEGSRSASYCKLPKLCSTLQQLLIITCTRSMDV